MQLFSFLSLAALARAYITSISVQESKLSPGSNATIVFNTSSYIQNWEDFSAVVGATRTDATSAPSLGQIVVGSIDFVALGKQNTGSGQFMVPMFLNSSMFTTGTNYIMNLAITSVVGASLETDVRFLNTSFST